jgi:Xaa-Pro dipeptidase
MILGISGEEYRQRLVRLGDSVSEAGLDLFVVSALDSIYYLTGAVFEPLERPFFLLVYPGNRRPPALLVPKLDEEHMRKARNIDEVHSYWEYPAPEGRRWPDRLGQLIGSAKQVGIEPSVPREISDRLEGFSVRCEPLVERLRLLKSPDEVRMIRRAAKYADMGVKQLLDASYSGATVAEGFARTSLLTRTIIREVADWDPLTTRVLMATWAAPRSAQPHAIPDLNDRLEEGPHVALVLTRVNGYAAESERTYFTAPPGPEILEAFKAMIEARRRAFALIRPGVPCSDLDAEVNEFLRGEGYGTEEQRLHRTGHGFGLGNHEPPWLAEGSSDVLAENMVISIEPGIYIGGSGGVRHSDTVLVTRDGYEMLTDMPVDLEGLSILAWKPWTRFRGWLVRRALGLESRGIAA